MLQKQSRVVATEISSPTKLKISSIWYFTENVYWPLVPKNDWQPGLWTHMELGSNTWNVIDKLGKPLISSEPYLPYLHSGDNNSSYFIGL